MVAPPLDDTEVDESETERDLRVKVNKKQAGAEKTWKSSDNKVR